MDTIHNLVVQHIEQLLSENGKPMPEIENSLGLMDDIGLSSLDYATLISFLETDLNIDPFMDGTIAVTDIRTVGELCKVYEEALKNQSTGG